MIRERCITGHPARSSPRTAPSRFATVPFVTINGDVAWLAALTLPIIGLAALYWVVKAAVREGIREARQDAVRTPSSLDDGGA